MKYILDGLKKERANQIAARNKQYALGTLNSPTAPEQQPRGPLGATADPRGLYGASTSSPSAVQTIDPGPTGALLGLDQPYQANVLTTAGHPTERNVIRDRSGQAVRARGTFADPSIVTAATEGRNAAIVNPESGKQVGTADRFGNVTNLVAKEGTERDQPAPQESKDSDGGK